MPAATAKTERTWEDLVDSDARDFYKGFLISKAHRVNSGWESNAEKSERFYRGDQWETKDKQELRNTNRAPSVFNMILPAVDLILGHMIQNRIDIMTKAVDRYADPYIARLLNQVIKQIEKSNLLSFERKEMFMDGLITGVGIIEKWWDTEENIEGKIKAQQRDSWDFFLDPYFKKYDYSDARVLYREIWYDRDQIKRKYGKKVAEQITYMAPMAEEFPTGIVQHEYNKPADYGNAGGYSEPVSDKLSSELGYDRKGKLIRVIEEYKKVWEEVEVYYDEETEKWENVSALSDDERELIKDTIIKTNKPHIHLRTLIGMEVVQDVALEATEFYHLFEFYFPYFINGKYMGVIKNLFYPQEEVNKRHSTIVHILSSMANTGIFYTEDAFSNEDEQDLNDKLARNDVAIKVDRLYDDRNQKTIEYRKPPDVQPIYERLEDTGKEDVKYISGAGDAIQGISQRKQSGVAKRIEVAQSAVRLTGIIENYVHTLVLGAKGFLWHIQNYYTTETMVRIYGERMGETDEEITLNKQAMNAIANDITIGEYDIVASVERQTPTEREHTFWKLNELQKATPEFADIIGEVVLGLFDLPEKDIILAKWRERQQMTQKMQQMGMMQQNNPNRGPIRSAPRPSAGPVRIPQRVQS